MPPTGSLAFGASSACFTLPASSLFGSGFGGSGCGCACGAAATGAGVGAGALAAGLGAGGSEQAMSAAARPSATMGFMLGCLPLVVCCKEPRDRRGVETVFVVAHLVSYHDLALLGEDRFHLLAPEAAQHVLHLVLIVRAMVFDRVETENAHQLFGKDARQEVVGLHTARLRKRQGVGEVRDAVPAVRIATVGVRQLFEQQPGRGAAVGVQTQIGG